MSQPSTPKRYCPCRRALAATSMALLLLSLLLSVALSTRNERTSDGGGEDMTTIHRVSAPEEETGLIHDGLVEVEDRRRLAIKPPSYTPLTGDRVERLKQVKLWAYQIQHLHARKSIPKLVKSPYQLIVIEPGIDKDYGPWPAKRWVNSLHKKQGRLVLAYIDVGEAENWRDYWKSWWKEPTKKRPGKPNFIVSADPDGWDDVFPVAYWNPAWQKIWNGENGIIKRLAAMGFDGVYLDWVEAYDDTKVIQAARKQNKKPALEMIKFIENIRKAGRNVIDDFLVVAQNAPFLINFAPARYAAAIDAVAMEDTWYHGAGDACWNCKGAGDLHNRHRGRWSTAGRLKQYKKYKSRGIPIFSVDYCRKIANARKVYTKARSNKLIPLVTRVSLSRGTVVPPWKFP